MPVGGGARAETLRPLPKAEEGRGPLLPGPTLPRLQGLCGLGLCFLLFELQFIQHTVPPFKACNRVTSSIFGVVSVFITSERSLVLSCHQPLPTP